MQFSFKVAILALVVAAIIFILWRKRQKQNHIEKLRKKMRCRLKRRRLARAYREQQKHAYAIVQKMRNFQNAFANGDWTALIQLGDVYCKGEYPWFKPNRTVASTIYHAACQSQDPKVAATARLKRIECGVDALAQEDVYGAELPTMFATECIEQARRLVQKAPDVTNVIVATHDIEILPDSQNVHDHGLVASLRKSLVASDSGGDAYADVLDLICNHSDSSEKQDAFMVLDTLTEDEHQKLQSSERSALNAVWNRIQGLPESDREDAKVMLVKQLASGVEHGSVVCSTGKIARIMGTLDGIVDEPLKPTWAIREEIGTLASKIRDSGGDEDTFRKESSQVYIENLGMDPKILKPIVDEFALGFA